MTEEKKDETIVGMTTETIAGDLLGMLVRQLALLPDIWSKVSEHEQKDFIERMKRSVTDNVKQAVKLIAAGSKTTVSADLQKIVFGKEVQAVFGIGLRDPGRLVLAESRGKACLIVITDATQHMGGVDEVKAMPNQPDLNGIDQSTKQIIEQSKRRSKDSKPQPKDKPKDAPKDDL